VVAAVRPARPNGHAAAWEALLAREGQVRSWVSGGGGQGPLSIVKIEELLARSGCVVPYRTLHRFAVERCGFRVTSTTVRVADGQPGVECQIDFAQLGFLQDAETGKRRRVHALIFTAVLSRHMFVWLTYSQTLAAVLVGCEAAWAFFGGVFKVLIPDNLKAVVTDADAVNPRLSTGWLDYAQHAGFVTDPARVRRPQDKARVAYCTSSGRCVGLWCSCRSPAGVSASAVRGGRVGSGRLVEDLVFVVIALPTDKSGVVPGLDGGGGYPEQGGHLGERDEPLVA
jgi:hypothetical protein